MIARLDGQRSQEGFLRPDTGQRRAVGSSFYRGETINFNPEEHQYDADGFLENFVLKGLLPDSPPISKGTKITAFGSCFAENITNHLGEIGFDLSRNRDPDIYISAMGEGLVNVHALLGQFEWALLDKKQPENLWHGFKAEGYRYDEDIRQRTRKVFLETEFFIVTLGLSEIWYDEITGGVFWRAVPLESFDASRHKFRVATFAETKSHLQSIYDLVRTHVPKARVLFTLSPVRLAATFRPVSCLTASSASKAILRAALDEMLRDNAQDVNTRLFYFPAYEIAQELFPMRFKDDCRHPRGMIISTIMQIFEGAYCQNASTLAAAMEKFRRTRIRNAALLSDSAEEGEQTSLAAENGAEKNRPRKNRAAQRTEKREARLAKKHGKDGNA